MNLRNDGSLPFLPDDHVIEVPAVVGADRRRRRLPIEPLPDDIRGLISHVAGYERLALDAAVHGGRDRVVRAMLAHPLVGQYDRAEKLTDLLIAGNRDHLAWATMSAAHRPRDRHRSHRASTAAARRPTPSPSTSTAPCSPARAARPRARTSSA